MNLISCDSCSAVLDKDKLTFPNKQEAWSDEAEDYDLTKVGWSHTKEDYVPFCVCPVCNSEILDES